MLPKSENKCENCVYEFIDAPEVKCGFHYNDMHEIRNNATKFFTLFLVLSKSEIKCKKKEQNFIQGVSGGIVNILVGGRMDPFRVNKFI